MTEQALKLRKASTIHDVVPRISVAKVMNPNRFHDFLVLSISKATETREGYEKWSIGELMEIQGGCWLHRRFYVARRGGLAYGFTRRCAHDHAIGILVGETAFYREKTFFWRRQAHSFGRLYERHRLTSVADPIVSILLESIAPLLKAGGPLQGHQTEAVLDQWNR